MRLSDYFVLALTKIRTRKIRSFLTMTAASVLLIFLMVGSFSYTGGRNSVQNAAPPALDGKHLALEDSFALTFSFGFDDPADFTGPSGRFIDQQEYERKTERFAAVARHTHVNLSGEFWNGNEVEQCSGSGSGEGLFGFSTKLSESSCIQAAVRSQALFDYFVAQDVTVDSEVAQAAAPVLVSTNYALGLAGQTFSDQDTPEQKVAKVAEARKAVLGSEFTVDYRLRQDTSLGDAPFIGALGSEPDNDAEVEGSAQVYVAGIIPEANLIKEVAGVVSFSVDQSAIVFAQSSLPDPLLVQTQKEQTNTGQLMRLTEFASVDQLVRYVDSGCRDESCVTSEGKQVRHTFFTDYGQAVEQNFSDAWSVLRWIILVWGAGVGLSIMSTTAKVIVDSRKEIGVFRAIGARRSQIFGVYAMYVTILALIASAISFVAARLITMYMDSRWADTISVQIALLNGSSEPRGQFSFFGVSFLQLGAIVGFVVVVALLGSALPVIRSLRKDPLRYLRED